MRVVIERAGNALETGGKHALETGGGASDQRDGAREGAGQGQSAQAVAAPLPKERKREEIEGSVYYPTLT